MRKWVGFRIPIVTLVMVLLLFVFSGFVAAKRAVLPVPGEGSGSLKAALTPEGANTSGRGTAQLRLNPQRQEICYVIHVSGIELPATAAHIHRGAVGISGPIVVRLTPPNAHGGSSGCANTPRDLIVAIIQHPADYYVNVHNAHYPEGAVRGQLSR